MSIEERVISVIRENLEQGGEAAITLESELAKDLKVDSLNALTILFCLEQEFAVSLGESSFAEYKTVRDLVAGLEKKYPLPRGA